jgi:hypothetical protein
MEQVRVFYDHTGNTLTVWFGEPQDEYVAEETGDEVVLKDHDITSLALRNSTSQCRHPNTCGSLSKP